MKVKHLLSLKGIAFPAFAFANKDLLEGIARLLFTRPNGLQVV